MILSSSPLVRATIAAEAVATGEGSAGSDHRRILGAERVAGLRVRELGDDADVAGDDLGDRDDRLAVRLAELRESLFLSERAR